MLAASPLLLSTIGFFLAGPPVLPDAPVDPAAAPRLQRPSGRPSAESAPEVVDPALAAEPTPVAPAPTPAPEVAVSPSPFVDGEDEAPLHRTDGTSWVRVEPPTSRGTGLFIGSAGLLASVGLFQLGDLLLCGGCAIGGVEHMFVAGSIALAGGGGHLRGRHDAYYDAALARPRDSRRSQVLIPSADADPTVDIDRGLELRVEDLTDDMAARARTPVVQLPPACDAALHRTGPLDDCSSRPR